MALVSQELHEKLTELFDNSDDLHDLLADHIKMLDLKFLKTPYETDIIDVRGEISSVDYISVHYVNVFNYEDDIFTCNIEFEASVSTELDVEKAPQYYGYDEYDSGYVYRTDQEETHLFSAEIEVKLTADAKSIEEIQSIYIVGNDLEISAGSIPNPWR
jgi:hypothetical protein